MMRGLGLREAFQGSLYRSRRSLYESNLQCSSLGEHAWRIAKGRPAGQVEVAGVDYVE